VSSNDRFLRNLADFSFKASGIRVAELLLNAVEFGRIIGEWGKIWVFGKIPVPFTHQIYFD
jgi:hypothetical protein